MTYSFVISPMLVQDFESEDELIERCKEWNLLSTTATRVKTYLYKRQGLSLPCEIVGYVDPQTVVIQFENKQQHCIHPAYLKEMQTASFGSRAGAVSEAAQTEDSGTAPEEVTMEDGAVDAMDSAVGQEESGDSQATPSMSAGLGAEEAEGDVADVADEMPEAPKKKPAKSSKKAALVLPEEKLQMTAVVKEFTTVPNHFSDNDDEVIIYEGVSVEGHDLAIEEVWSSHSATLKKLELAVGDTVSFEAKVVAKKLTQHPVKYKINNPSKMKKLG